MNIKEHVANIRSDLYANYMTLIGWDEDIFAVEEELERLWRIEECANEAINLTSGSSYEQWKKADDALKKALEAAKG